MLAPKPVAGATCVEGTGPTHTLGAENAPDRDWLDPRLPWVAHAPEAAVKASTADITTVSLARTLEEGGRTVAERYELALRTEDGRPVSFTKSQDDRVVRQVTVITIDIR
jgi:hypothetical protein